MENNNIWKIIMKIIKNRTAIKNSFYSLFLVFFAYSGFTQNSDILSSHASDQIIVTDWNNFKIVSNGQISNRGRVDLNN